jgi:hypothetical protein
MKNACGTSSPKTVTEIVGNRLVLGLRGVKHLTLRHAFVDKPEDRGSISLQPEAVQGANLTV